MDIVSLSFTFRTLPTFATDAECRLVFVCVKTINFDELWMILIICGVDYVFSLGHLLENIKPIV